MLDTISLFRGNHQWKAGFDFNYVDHKMQALPLHFGGRYLFQPLPAIPGLLPRPITGIQALALGLPAAYIQGYGNSSATYGYSDLSLFAQDDWRVSAKVTLKMGVRYQNQFWPGTPAEHARSAGPYRSPARQQQHCAARRGIVGPAGNARTIVHGGLRGLLRQRDYRRRRDRLHHQRPAGRANIGCEIPHANRGVERARPQAA